MGAAPVHVLCSARQGRHSRPDCKGPALRDAATSLAMVQIATLLKVAGADLDATAGNPVATATYLLVEQGELDLLCAPPVIIKQHTPAHGQHSLACVVYLDTVPAC